MICPYATHIEQYIRHVYTLDDDGRVTQDDCALKERHLFADCPKEACGAWRDGRCGYVGAKE
ncbi:MAG: hypothetical protein RSD27_11025 [Ruthenibacterium sp.]